MTATAEIETTLKSLLNDNWTLNDTTYVFTRTDYRVQSGIHDPRIVIGHGTITRDQDEANLFTYIGLVRCVKWAETIADIDAARSAVWNMVHEVYRIISDEALVPDDWDSMTFAGSTYTGQENELPSVFVEECRIKIKFFWRTT